MKISRQTHDEQRQPWLQRQAGSTPGLLAALVASVTLTACGGGGAPAVTDTAPAPKPSVADLQGRWSGTLGLQSARAVHLSDGTAWIVQYDTSDAPVAVMRGRWTVVGDLYSGTGRRIDVPEGTASDVSMAVARWVNDTSLSGTLGGVGFNWTYGGGGSTAPPLSAWAGNWLGNVGGGRATMSWTITTAGAVSGISTTGCAYDGRLEFAAGAAAVTMAVRERCAGFTKDLAGIGTMDSDSSTQAAFVYTATNETAAGVFRLSRQ